MSRSRWRITRGAACACVLVGIILGLSSRVRAEERDGHDLAAQVKLLAERLDKVESEARSARKELVSVKRGMEVQKEEFQAQLKEIRTETVKQLANTAQLLEDEGGPVVSGLGKVDMAIGATFVGQTTFDADDISYAPMTDTQEGDKAELDYTVDMEFSAPVGDNGLAYLYLEAGEGMGLGSKRSIFAGFNGDAVDTGTNVNFAEVWYEHRFLDGEFTVNVGKIDPTRFFDANAVANDETSQFLSGLFVNQNTVEFPGYSPGIRLSYAPADWFEMQGGSFASDDNGDNYGSDPFVIGEVAFKPVLFGKRQGNYRFYAWHNDAKRPEYRESLFRSFWHDFDRDEKNEGFGLSFDQELCDYTTAFLRAGWQDEDVAPVSWSWSAGLQANLGWLNNRENDVLGFAVGQSMISKAYEKSFAPNAVRDFLWGITNGTGGFWRTLRDAGQPDENEFMAEVYYNYFVNDHLSLTADAQYVSNPAGLSKANDLFVLGLRAQLNF
ncbi:carbohydrate porin [Candidatus Hydrogenedentota bacterium]